MASKKKESEGIALLSMYNDEDDDMEDHDEEDAEEDEYKVAVSRDDDSYTNDLSDPTDPVQENTPVIGSGLRFTPQHSQPPQSSPLQLAPPAEPRKNRDGKLAIVDYGHDEVALSPEAEEGEIMLNGDLQTASGDFHEKDSSETVQVMAPGVPATSQSPEQLAPSHSDLDAVDNAAVQIESMEVEEAVKISVVVDDDFLEKFLPPPLKRKCSEELQEKINKFLAYKRNGKSFNAEVRNRKDYRNPDFLLHAVRYQDIDQIGSCFGKDVFDPHGYDKSDYYDEIEADMKREMERKEQERKKSPKVEFVSGAAQPGNVSGSSKVTLPVPGMSNVATSGLVPVPTASDVLSRESRQNKKSKWDKVDGDRRNPMPPSGGQESVGAHAALLSAANAGAGYTAFAQQRRREAEEKRSSERRLERRS